MNPIPTLPIDKKENNKKNPTRERRVFFCSNASAIFYELFYDRRYLYTAPAIPAATIGTTINNQSCETAQSPTNNA